MKIIFIIYLFIAVVYAQQPTSDGHGGMFLNQNKDKKVQTPKSIIIWDTLMELDLKTLKPEKISAIVNKDNTIQGYVIPLEYTKDKKIKEVLLLPYVPSCAHVPPPTANQIVHVKLKNPEKLDDEMFWMPH